jgi:hypothetical protein
MKKTKSGKAKGIVFSTDMAFSAMLVAVMVFTLGYHFQSPRLSTQNLQETAQDELTVFDKSGVFKSLTSCAGDRNSVVSSFLQNSLSKVFPNGAAELNVTVYEFDSSFSQQCTASGAFGKLSPSSSASGSKRLFYTMQNNRQFFGLAEIKVGVSG